MNIAESLKSSSVGEVAPSVCAHSPAAAQIADAVHIAKDIIKNGIINSKKVEGEFLSVPWMMKKSAPIAEREKVDDCVKTEALFV